MFAINHAATALLIKRRYPQVSMVWLLISVQLMELVWVALNLVDIEHTTTEPMVNSVADIHLSYMPYSHSVATMLGVSALVWLVCRFALAKPYLAAALAIGIASHLVLDLITHAPDIQLAPGVETGKLGLGLYSALPLGAFVLELAYGTLCWWIYRGGKALLVVVLVFNVANLSLLSPNVPGAESMLAGRPTAIVLVILLQIVVTLALVGWFSRHTAPPRAGQAAVVAAT